MQNNILFLIFIYFVFIIDAFDGLKTDRIKKYYFAINNKNVNITDTHKNNFVNNIKKICENKKENKFLHCENKKKISINPLFQSLCKNVSVSETCLNNIQRFYSKVNNINLKKNDPKENRYFCAVLYGKYENNEFVKIENVFFSINLSESGYDVEYLLNSEDRKKADKLAKMLNLEVVGFLFSYPDIGIDLDVYNKKKKMYIKLNKKMKTLNDEENEIFIPMGGKEVLLSLMVLKQILDEAKESSKETNKIHDNANEYRDYKVSKSKKKHLNDKNNKPNMKPFITLSVGMNKNTESIIVEAYEINYDLVKLINYNIIKDIKKQNSILQFEKKNDEKEVKIKKFDSEIDIMSELYLKCKTNILIEKIELKKIDILFCVNNIPIFSHKSNYNFFFPYPSNSNYYNILQKFNNMIKTIDKKKDIVNIFRDFNFLLFLTNFFSISHDIPYFCVAVNDVTNSISIPERYIHILKNLLNFLIS